MSCADDTARWLLCQLGGGELDGHRLISTASLLTTRSLQFPVSGLPVEQDDTYRVHGYAMGWMVATYRGRHHLSHGGGIDGFTTEFVLLPSDHIGVAVCSNGQTQLPTALCRHILDSLLGAEPRDWGREMQAQSEKARAAMKEEAERDRRVVPGAGPAHPIAEYAGRYEHPGYGAVEVGGAGDALSVALGAMRFEVTHRHYETFDLKLSELGELRFTANFHTDESGSVSEVMCSFEPSVGTVRFTRVADPRLFDQGFLEGLAGTYTLGPATVEIVVEVGPKLVGSQNGARFDLVPAGGMRFRVPMVPGLTLEFVLDDAGRATAIATSQGTLTRVD
jgi:hypothetical protein